jgi:hypothetical protein
MSIKGFPLFKRVASDQNQVLTTPRQTPDDMRSRLMQMAERRKLALRERSAH